MISVYPIPTQNTIWLKNISASQIEEAELIDAKGKKILKYGKENFISEQGNSKLILDTDLATGTYILIIKQKTKLSFAKLLLM
jgi:hypothetical protein